MEVRHDRQSSTEEPEMSDERIDTNAELLDALEATVFAHTKKYPETVIVDIIGVIELLKHKFMSDARDSYVNHIKMDEIRREATYVG